MIIPKTKNNTRLVFIFCLCYSRTRPVHLYALTRKNLKTVVDVFSNQRTINHKKGDSPHSFKGLDMKLIHGKTPVQFDLFVAQKYKNKENSAHARNLSFTLTFAQFRHLFTRKTCGYTGVIMTVSSVDGAQPETDLTIERIDNSKGYEFGNVIAVCKAANALKAVLENPMCTLNVEHGVRMFAKIAELNKKKG